ncbi:diaminopimelate epimerase [Anoxynatronum buryatiense]|uniref:Diaminopimelate epimerase n=1 Tax=Anoxynatronum buryatiense TaxID=489973 RepID=A0AA45WV55_9CLOT|nr:diaminopimelate epimerase [Anoxynatronum buryatiense]SMP46832.1 diaminopimelate epimerase [Anoxynatronum buryatiense]
MKIPFVKMQGIGNDFILVKEMELPAGIEIASLVKNACHRRFGIGADGLMVAAASSVADARMDYYNSDGSRGEMCGNGIRCFARYIDAKASSDKREMRIETLAGVIALNIRAVDINTSEVSVDMGKPVIHTLHATLEAGGQSFEYAYVTMGVPHVVIFTDSPVPDLVDQVGPMIEKHALFPDGTNVNFCYIENSRQARVMTWERGAGHTLACGTGITSVCAVAHQLGLVKDEVQVNAEGGQLHLAIYPDQRLVMTGPATDICHGEYLHRNDSI